MGEESAAASKRTESSRKPVVLLEAQRTVEESKSMVDGLAAELRGSSDWEVFAG